MAYPLLAMTITYTPQIQQLLPVSEVHTPEEHWKETESVQGEPRKEVFFRVTF